MEGRCGQESLLLHLVAGVAHADSIIQSSRRLAVVLWVGVALPLLGPHYLFARIHMSVLMIDAMNTLVQLALTCCLLAVWRKR